jgi:DNA polymerase (family 10)
MNGKSTNARIADLLRRYAAALSVEGANRFKLKAYRRAAETIEGLSGDITDQVRRGGDLTELPGIGKAISEIIVEIVETGKLSRLDRSIAKQSPQVRELAAHPALDPKKVARIYKKLGLRNVKELKASLEEGTIGEQFGSRMENHVRHGLDERPRSLLYDVQDLAKKFEADLRALPGVTNTSSVGSLRRRKDTVGDLNFLVAGRSAAAVWKRIVNFSSVLSAKKRDATERAFLLSSGLTATVRWTPSEAWGRSLILATGSVAHLAELHARANAKKIPGLSTAGKTTPAASEADIYASFGLAYIEPELREGRGEIAAAARNKLPKPVELSDLRGDLHMHTTASDGANSIAEMARAAQERGYEYIAITDHSQSLKIANGLSEKRLGQHLRNIDKINARLKGIRILKSAEVDILEDGRLDYSQSMLRELDFTICSIHSRFGLNKKEQTERILRAMDNRQFNILGHATGRLLLKRPGYVIEIERVMRHAKANGCFFEINSSPDRLDLSDEHTKLAKELSIKIAVNTDAHSIRELDFVSAGINQARRGWLESTDVLNTCSLKDLLVLLRR